MKVINLYGGPGTGKSTTAALVFGELKKQGEDVELVTEVAKDIVWENRMGPIERGQPYIFGKQLWRTERLRNQVDYVVTDSPILLSVVYAKDMGEHWGPFVKDMYDKFHNVNIFLERDNHVHPYNPNGRFQKKVEEAEVIDKIIRETLRVYSESFHVVSVGQPDYIHDIVEVARSN